ncbi:MAG: hypothetical protein AAF802_31675 [Planctomycetota bacterium]
MSGKNVTKCLQCGESLTSDGGYCLTCGFSNTDHVARKLRVVQQAYQRIERQKLLSKFFRFIFFARFFR